MRNKVVGAGVCVLGVILGLAVNDMTIGGLLIPIGIVSMVSKGDVFI